MNEKKGPTMEESPMKRPSEAVVRSQSFGTIVADDVICTVDTHSQICTITLLQQHPIPKQNTKGFILDRLESELRLEIKIPLESAWRLAFFLRGIFDEVKRAQKKGGKPKIYFGPTYVGRVEKNDEEKQSNSL